MVATNDYHGGCNCAQNGHVDNVVEKVQEMGIGARTISVAYTRAKVAASCDVPER